MSLAMAYTLIAGKQILKIQDALVSLIREHFVSKDGESYWTDDIGEPADKKLTKAYQEKVRSLRQQITNISQRSLVSYWEANEENCTITPELDKEYSKVAPLVWRRDNLLWVVNNIIQPESIQQAILDDGVPFSFSEPVDIVTELLFCNCGQFPLPPDEMLEGELQLATEHLAVCQFTRSETKTEKSVVIKHTKGNWDCKGCYKSPFNNGVGGTEAKSDIDWCPRFLRGLRHLTPQAYSTEIKGQRSCYAGLLHRQISIEIHDGKQYIIREQRCDTCGYTSTEKAELVTSVDKAIGEDKTVYVIHEE